MAQVQAKAKPKVEGGGNTVKLAIAIVCLLAGGVLIAWNFGAFDKVLPAPKYPEPTTKITPEMKKAYERQKIEREQAEKEGKAPEQAGS